MFLFITMSHAGTFLTIVFAILTQLWDTGCVDSLCYSIVQH